MMIELRNKIYIYSDAIQTGKTTRVLAWVNNQPNICGILTPDIADKRKLYDISKRQLHDFETFDKTNESIVAIGKYIFLESAFNQAKEILKKALDQKPIWLVVDEIGKLEMDGKGLEPELTSVLNSFSEQSPHTKILLIIRDSLLESAQKKFQLKNAKVVGYTYFLKPLVIQ